MVKHKMGLRIAVELTGWKDTPSFEKSGWGQDYKTAGVKTRWWQFRAVGSAQACLQSGTKQMSRTVKWWASVSRQVVDLSRRWGASGVEWLERVEKELLTEAADPSSPQMWWLVNTCRHGVLSESSVGAQLSLFGGRWEMEGQYCECPGKMGIFSLGYVILPFSVDFCFTFY